jgi:hypothetical protein
MERSGVVALSVVGLLVSAVWWLAGLVLSESDHTACGRTVSADVAFALSYVGLALGIGAWR